MTEVVYAVVAFAFLAISLVIAGGIDARLMQRHPAESGRLGPMQNNLPLGFDLFGHISRWVRFLFWENFSRGDAVLSALCVAYLGNLVALCMFGIWLTRGGAAAV